MNDKNYENIGRLICNISYWFYAIKFVAVVTGISAVVLYIFDLPLWIAPIVGVVVFIVYQFIRRMIFKILLKLSKM